MYGILELDDLAFTGIAGDKVGRRRANTWKGEGGDGGRGASCRTYKAFQYSFPPLLVAGLARRFQKARAIGSQRPLLQVEMLQTRLAYQNTLGLIQDNPHGTIPFSKQQRLPDKTPQEIFLESCFLSAEEMKDTLWCIGRGRGTEESVYQKGERTCQAKVQEKVVWKKMSGRGTLENGREVRGEGQKAPDRLNTICSTCCFKFADLLKPGRAGFIHCTFACSKVRRFLEIYVQYNAQSWAGVTVFPNKL